MPLEEKVLVEEEKLIQGKENVQKVSSEEVVFEAPLDLNYALIQKESIRS